MANFGNDRFWFLSIDEATKTLGHCILSISKVDTHELMKKIDLMATSGRTDELKNVQETIKNYVTLHACATVDLIPDKKDGDISLVERISAFRKYVDSVLESEIKRIVPANSNLNVVLEFIMGHNHKVNVICSSAIYAFSNRKNCNVLVVKPAYKNQIHFQGVEETYLAHWQGKTKTSYDANKKHGVALFQHVAKMFNFKIGHLSKKEISHVADAVMGIFGLFWADRQSELI